MFSSLQARMMRTAISPRFDTRIFSNISVIDAVRWRTRQPGSGARSGWPNLEQGLAEFDGFGVFNQDLREHALGLGFDFVHDLHGLDDANNALRVHVRADLDIGGGFRRRGAVESTDHRRFDFQLGGTTREGRGNGGLQGRYGGCHAEPGGLIKLDRPSVRNAL